VLDGDPAPSKRGMVPNFRPMSIVAKQPPISATAELLHEKTQKSYEEFDVDFKEFCAHTKHVFSVIDSQKVAY